jgi:predicted DNA-binding transcriptional regulator AlpA
MTGIEQKMRFSPLLTLDDLAALLGRSPDTIKKDMRRNPAAVPPRLILPQTRLLRWRPADVERWLESFAEAPVSEIEGGLK